jgi:Cu+-exporting ATPase
MHPEVRQDGPGDCPKCGMHLVPEDEVSADEHSHCHAHGVHQSEGAATGEYDIVPPG